MAELKVLKFLEPEVADDKLSTEASAVNVTEKTSGKSSVAGGSDSTITSLPRISRLSRMFQSISIRRSRRSTFVRPVLRYQPTYRLESKNPFKPRVVEDLLEALVESHMKARGTIKFKTNTVEALCRALSDEILTQVKAKNYDRYRIIATVSAGEKFHQHFRQCAGFLWNSDTDAMANYVYERPDIFIISTVYGIYYD